MVLTIAIKQSIKIPMIKIPTHEKLLQDIEAYLEKTDMKAHIFGEKFFSDSGAISRLRNGADPRLSKVIKIYRIIG